MTASRNRTIALCGPSGVGKEYLKTGIRAEVGAVAEPVVATTRERRPKEAQSRQSGLTEAEFQFGVEGGTIVLPHRPFRANNTPWYGFLRSSFDFETTGITEAHSTVLEDFQELMGSIGRSALVIGLVAPEDTLVANLESSGRCTTEDDARLRLMNSILEVAEINDAAATGLVDVTFDMSLDSREQSVLEVIDLARRFYE